MAVVYVLYLFFCIGKTIMSANPLTIPAIAGGTFTTGPKDDVATADIYKVVSATGSKVKPITSIQELNTQLGSGFFGMELDPTQAADFLSKDKDGLVFDKDLLTARLLGVSSEIKGSMSSLSELMKNNAMASTFADKANSLSCTIGDSVGGVKSMVSSANIKDVRALGGFVNSYTGSKIFNGKDSGAIAGLLGSVVTTSSNLGISGTFKTLTETVNDNGIIARMTRAVLPVAFQNSDTRLLREMANGPAGKLINVYSPGFAQSFSRSFSYQGGTNYGSRDQFGDVMSVFETVNGGWDTIGRGDGLADQALNLFSIVGGSRAFQNLVMTGVRYWNTESNKPQNPVQPPFKFDPLYALASAFQEISVGQALKRDFPKTALLNSYNGRLVRRNNTYAGVRKATNVNVIDPRLVSGVMGALFGSR